MTTITKPRTSAQDKVDVYEIVTAKVITALTEGKVPWQRSWSTAGLPKSLSTRKPYRGINVFLLGLASLDAEYESPYWGTYRKIAELGGQVRKGEKGTLVTFWKRFEVDEKDENGSKTGKRGSRFILRYFNVFNTDQADWPEGSKPPKIEKIEGTQLEREAAAEAIIAGYQAAPTIRYGGDEAFYVTATDTVTLPPLTSYKSVGEFYSTAFHELTHSTGHESRLDREGVRNGSFSHFGSPTYSKEELVAEFGAALLLGVAGLDTTGTIENSGAYLRGWLKALTDDPKLIVHAAAQAQRAADHVRGVTFANGGEDD